MSATIENGGFLIMECKVNECSNEVVYKTKELCRKCYMKTHSRINYKANKERILTKQKEYRDVNKEKIKYKYEARKELKPLYNTWSGMKQRCYDFNNKDYKHYGGRGITVCERWFNSYENFENDMGVRPEGHTLDRIDVNGNYEPSNCKWSTYKEQANNRRNNKAK